MKYKETITRAALFAYCLLLVIACSENGMRGKSNDLWSDEDGSDSETETYESFECDCSSSTGSPIMDLATAITVCPGIDMFSLATFSSFGNMEKVIGVVESIGTNGCMVTRHGCKMVEMSTGLIGSPNSDAGVTSEKNASVLLDPMPAFNGYELNEGEVQPSCDVGQLTFTLTSPPGIHGFSFDFLFATTEEGQTKEGSPRDTFYAILSTDGLNNGAKTNIAFDDERDEINRDSVFFEDDLHQCDESGSIWSSESGSGSGSTGWLETTWPIEPETTFTLTFSIHDEGDCLVDSMVLLDNFRWVKGTPEPRTFPI